MTRRTETFDLLRDQRAFSLFAYIALRARWSNSLALGLQRGQMVLGRHSAARELGLKQGQIREAIKRLISANHIAISSTKRGTVVTLLSDSIFDFGLGGSATNSTANRATPAQPTNSQPTAINEERNNEKKVCVADGTHTDFPSWFSSVAALHPTKDAAACWPRYVDHCQAKRRTPTELGFGDWLDRETEHLISSKKAKTEDLAPAGWQTTLRRLYPEAKEYLTWATLPDSTRKEITNEIRANRQQPSSRSTRHTALECVRTDF